MWVHCLRASLHYVVLNAVAACVCARSVLSHILPSYPALRKLASLEAFAQGHIDLSK